MTHNAVGAFCRSVKLQCELYPSREVAICLDPYCGLGFVLWCLCRCGSPEGGRSSPLLLSGRSRFGWVAELPEGLCVLLGSVYSGHQSILIPPVELESNPALWLLAVSQLRVRDTFCSYSVMELCTKGLGLQTEALKVRERRRVGYRPQTVARVSVAGEASDRRAVIHCSSGPPSPR